MRGNPHAAFDVAGAGNVAWSRCCDTRRRKGETTGNTNFDLHRRASPRPYLREAGGEIPPAYSPLHPDGARLRLSGRGARLVQPPRAVVAPLDHHGGGVLRRGA